jgi:hypothetical protein
MTQAKLKQPLKKPPLPSSPPKTQPEEDTTLLSDPINARRGEFETIGDGCYRRLPTMRE